MLKLHPISFHAHRLYLVNQDMRKLYLFVYNNNLGERQEVSKMLDCIADVTDWRYDLPNCFYIVSEKSSDELTDLILDHCKGKQTFRFLITEISPTNRQGWLPKSTWDFLNNFNSPVK